MKIAIVNQPLGNRGDEAAHRAMVRSLLNRFTNAQIDVLFINENQFMIDDFIVKSNLIRYINIQGIKKGSIKCMKNTMIKNRMFFTKFHPLLRKINRTMSKYDYVICAPGGICMGGFMKWDHIWQLYIAMKHDVKIIYWGRSIGPFTDEDVEHAEFKKISQNLIAHFDYISLRDDISYKIAESFGSVPDLTVDSAFLETPICSIPDYISNKLNVKPYVVFVPNELKWHYKYKDKSKKCIDGFYQYIIDALVSAFPNHQIVMLPQTCKTTINDYKYFISLRDNSKHKNDIIVIDENQSSDIQQSIINGSKFIIGARYHSIVFAINNKIPFLSLSYEHKMRGMLDILNLNSRQIDIENIFNSTDESVDRNILKEVKDKINDVSFIDNEAEQAKYIVHNTFNNMCECLMDYNQ